MRERSILIGAAPSGATERLEDVLRRAGLRVERVGRGPEVIERALFSRYDAVVLDATVELLAAPQVRDLLKANPRTQTLPVHLIDLEGRAGAERELYIADPLDNLHWLDGLLLAQSAAPARGGALQARLEEVALIDMLQMLIQNRRYGVVELIGASHIGRIELAGDRFGRISLDDSVGGLKALARMVALAEGELRFEPRDDVTAQMEGSAEAILFEAVQLRDEADRYRQELPPGSRVLLKAGGERCLPHHGLLEDILLLVDFYGSVDDILERLEYPDAEILKGILALRDDGWVDLYVPETGDASAAMFADITLDPRWHNEPNPTVWLFGRDADVVRLLWSDPRFKRRVLVRRSLRNPGRFGGNGWFVEIGGVRNVWLRSIEPFSGAEKFALRQGLSTIGGIFLLSERGGDDLEAMVSLALALVSAGMRAVWLPIEAAAGVEHTDAWIGAVAAELPGRLLKLNNDVAAGLWHALAAVLGPDEAEDV